MEHTVTLQAQNTGCRNDKTVKTLRISRSIQSTPCVDLCMLRDQENWCTCAHTLMLKPQVGNLIKLADTMRPHFQTKNSRTGFGN
jgi:hypothetical protein